MLRKTLCLSPLLEVCMCRVILIHADCPPELETIQSQVAAVSAAGSVPIQHVIADVTPALVSVQRVQAKTKKCKGFGGLAPGFFAPRPVRCCQICKVTALEVLKFDICDINICSKS
jgi:hypothetical protein